MTHFISYFLYAFIAIFPITNPIGMSSLFYAMTENGTHAERALLTKKVVIYGILLLLATLFIGPYILLFFGIRAADIKIAGGLVLFSVAWKMLNQPKQNRPKASENPDDDQDLMSLAFFPLTMPLTAGSGSIAITITLAIQAKDAVDSLYRYGAITAALIVIFAIVYICYRYAEVIFNVLGKTGAKVVSSLSAFILLAIAISVTWDGLQTLITSIVR